MGHPNEGEYHVAGTLSSSILNGNCDHALNKVECNFDGGDCCGSNSNIGFCKNTAEGTQLLKIKLNQNYKICLQIFDLWCKNVR